MEKAKKKVLHILKSSIYSGAEKIAILIIKECSDEFEMAYVSTAVDIKDKLDENNIKYYLLDEFKKDNLEKLILSFNPDIIHKIITCSYKYKNAYYENNIHYKVSNSYFFKFLQPLKKKCYV